MWHVACVRAAGVRPSVLLRTASSLEEIYETENLATRLGSLKVQMAEDANGRQDMKGGLVLPAPLTELLAKAPTNPHFECEIETVALETAYIHYMRLVGIALKEQFGPAVESHIGHLVRNVKWCDVT